MKRGLRHAASEGAVRAAVVSIPPEPGVVRQAYQLQYVLSGMCVVEQDCRRAALHTGDFALSERSRPIYLAFPGSSTTQLMTLAVPRGVAPLPLAAICHLTVARPCNGRGVDALVSAVLGRLARDLGTYEPAEGTRVCAAVLDLVAAALGSAAGSNPAANRRDTLRQAIFAFIEERLGNPDLSPTTIAAAHHISTRLLHKLFEGSGATVSEWIRLRRLDRCRRDLTDPALVDRPVGRIAARWGFVDAAHFSRSFRARYHMSPSHYRSSR